MHKQPFCWHAVQKQHNDCFTAPLMLLTVRSLNGRSPVHGSKKSSIGFSLRLGHLSDGEKEPLFDTCEACPGDG